MNCKPSEALISSNSHLAQSSLQWNNFTVLTKADRKILDNISGEITSGQSLAIMGSSGAGKTTLLNYLSKKCGTNAGLKKSNGKIRLIKNGIDETKSFTALAGYVTQDDILFEVLTPLELFTFAADIKLVDKTREEKEQVVNNLIKRLDLEKCKNTRVGSVILKGLSGGEKKRTAVGYELIREPLVLFLDEPTTGLDSISAFKVVSLIIEEARLNNRIVIFTIHQPKTEIFNLFDQFLLLAQGKSMYQGNAKDAMKYFAKLGYQCPANYNPAEYYIKILSKQAKYVDELDISISSRHDGKITSVQSYSNDNHKSSENQSMNLSSKNENEGSNYHDQTDKDPEVEQDYEKVIEKFEIAARENLKLTDFKDIPVSTKKLKMKQHNFFVELGLLSKRNFKILLKNFKYLIVRVLFSIVSCLLIITIFNSVGHGNNAVQDRNGVLFFTILNVIQSNFQTCMLVFTEEKPKFYKEQENHMYSIACYYLSKTIVEIPLQIILSSLNFGGVYFITGLNSSSYHNYLLYFLTIFLAGYAGSAMAFFISAIIDSKAIIPVIFPFLILTQIQSSGFFINSKDIPMIFAPFKYISLFKYGYQALCWNEYEGYTPESLDCKDPVKCIFPTKSFSEGLFWSLMSLLIIALSNNVLAYITMIFKTKARKPK
jgi:ABC-type multidrug transport system ATPase subunit